MRKILSAIIIDPEKDKHNYAQVHTGYGKYFENSFDLKVITKSEGILDEINDFKGFDALLTIGNDIDFNILNNLSFEYRKKWVHFNEFEPFQIAVAIISTFKCNINRDRENDKLFSIFTCTFNTPGSYLDRLYKSLCRQTYKNWNWWILDDSKEDCVVRRLSKYNDPRITIIRNFSNHGNIGFNKHTIASICDGDYLVEVDHDDELTDNCLSELYRAFKTYPDCGFVYSYAMEEMDGIPVKYDEGFALGLGKYEDHYVNGVKYNVAITCDVNAMSVRHIVGLPNHVRCWERNLYHNIGGHNIELSVLDDMELLIKTFLNTRICKIPEVLYIQHEGTEKDGNGRGSTTQGQRLKEIGRVGFLLKEKYDVAIHNRLLELGVSDAVWEKDNIGEYSNIFNTAHIPELENVNYTLDVIEKPAE